MILARFGGRRVACVAMLDTYRVRHAVRDVGAALSLPPSEIDAIAKAFPHLRARDARARPARPAGTAVDGSRRAPAGSAVRPRGVPGRAAPPHRPASVRSAAQRPDPARSHPGGGEFRRLPDESVRQGRRRGVGPAQARRARDPDAVGHGPRAGRDPPDRGRRDRAGRPAVAGRTDLRADPAGADARAVSRSSRRASGSWWASSLPRRSTTW